MLQREPWGATADQTLGIAASGNELMSLAAAMQSDIAASEGGR